MLMKKTIFSILVATALIIDIFVATYAIANHFAKDTDSIDDIIELQKIHGQKIAKLDSVITDLKSDVVVLQKLRSYNHD